MAALAATAAVAGHAQGGDGFWNPTPQRSNYERAMDEGDRQAARAARESSARSRRHHARLAAEAYEEAARLDPEAPAPHFLAALSLYDPWVSEPRFTSDRDLRHLRQVIHHFDEFERLAPNDPRVTSQVLFRRALTLSKLGGRENYLRSVDDYDRLLAIGGDQASATILANSAETLMAAGKLEDAIERYEEAVDRDPRALHRHGLAVALDRDGQAERAREILNATLRHDDSGPMRWLTDRDVFFIPRGDIDYYFALGHEIAGNYYQALRFYRRFVRHAISPLYKPHALNHIRRIEAMPRHKRRPPANAYDPLREDF